MPEIDPLVAPPEWRYIHPCGVGARGQPIPHVLHLLESRGVRVFSLVRSVEMSALSRFGSYRPFICLRTDKTAERSIFDMAHELGHLVLHRNTTPRGREVERQADAVRRKLPHARIRRKRRPALRNPDLDAHHDQETLASLDSGPQLPAT